MVHAKKDKISRINIGHIKYFVNYEMHIAIKPKYTIKWLGDTK